MAFVQPGLSQIGENKDQLSKKYGVCSPDLPPRPQGPNAYDSVLDVGDLCYFHHGGLRITAFFKGGRAEAFFYHKKKAFSGKAYPYAELTDGEIASLLRVAMPHAEWISVSSAPPIRRWRTSDSSVFAYYFAAGPKNRYSLLVQTAAVDAVYRKVDRDSVSR